METIDFDLPCVKCGYNLRTLRRDAKCPECGEPVQSALDARERAADRLAPIRSLTLEQRVKLRDAMTISLASWCGGIACVMISDQVMTSDVGFGIGTLVLLPMVACFVLGCWASRELSLGAAPGFARSACRWLPWVVLASCAFEHLNIFWLRSWFDYPTDRSLWAINFCNAMVTLGSLSSLAQFVLLGCTFALFSRLSAAADRYFLRLFFIAAGWLSVLIAIFLVGAVSESAGSSRSSMALRVSPVGTSPIGGALLKSAIGNPPSDGFEVFLAACVLFVQVGLPIAWLILRGRVIEAGRDGITRGSNSPSSPSPHPPA